MRGRSTIYATPSRAATEDLPVPEKERRLRNRGHARHLARSHAEPPQRKHTAPYAFGPMPPLAGDLLLILSRDLLDFGDELLRRQAIKP
jgi:hypothetical protein